MEICILAGGKQANTPEAEITNRYLSRLPWKSEIFEISESRRRDDSQLAKRFLKRLESRDNGLLIALDEKGEQVSSQQMAVLIDQARQTGVNRFTFMIGGANGLPGDCLKMANKRIAFGRATWPHLLIRGMLAEQLYRASTILAGHPYHRA